MYSRRSVAELKVLEKKNLLAQATSGHLFPSFDWFHVLLWSVVGILAIEPYLYIFYPGIVEIDTVFQLAEHLGYGDGFNGPGSWTSLFPIFCAHFYGTIFEIGTAVGGSQTFGIFSITLFQSASLCFMLSLLAGYSERWNVPGAVRIIALLLTLLIPIFPHQAVDIGKDGLFTIFFMGYAVCVLEAVRTKGENLFKPSWVIFTSAMAILLALSRSTGIYLIVITVFAMLAFTCRKWKTLALHMVPLVCALLAAFALSMYSTNVLHVTKLGLREMLGTPIHQTTDYVRQGGYLADEEYYALDDFYDLEQAVEHFEPQMTDNTKSYYRAEKGSEALVPYLQTYLAIGMRAPQSYFNTWYNLYSGYIELGKFDDVATCRFMPTVSVHDLGMKYSDGMDLPDDLDKMKEFIRNGYVGCSSTQLGEYRDDYPDFGIWQENKEMQGQQVEFFCFLLDWEKVPVLNLLVSKSLYALYLPALILLVSLVSRRRRYLLPAMVPMLCIVLFAFVSPVDFTRYVMPNISTCFILAAIAFSNLRFGWKSERINPEG